MVIDSFWVLFSSPRSHTSTTGFLPPLALLYRSSRYCRFWYLFFSIRRSLRRLWRRACGLCGVSILWATSFFRSHNDDLSQACVVYVSLDLTHFDFTKAIRSNRSCYECLCRLPLSVCIRSRSLVCVSENHCCCLLLLLFPSKYSIRLRSHSISWRIVMMQTSPESRSIFSWNELIFSYCPHLLALCTYNRVVHAVWTDVGRRMNGIERKWISSVGIVHFDRSQVSSSIPIVYHFDSAFVAYKKRENTFTSSLAWNVVRFQSDCLIHALQHNFAEEKILNKCCSLATMMLANEARDDTKRKIDARMSA